MRKSSLRLARGLLALAACLALSGCGGSSKTAPADSTYAAAPEPVIEAPILQEEPTPIAFVAPTLEPIHFAFNEHRITPQAEIALQSVSVVMKEHPDWTLLLEGHCDERGTDEYNLTLGENRARAAKRYLVSLGIGEDRFETFSYGEDRPVDLGDTEDAWARNRRTEFRLEEPGS
jgi:peptidoglycan-associated lipoprotein